MMCAVRGPMPRKASNWVAVAVLTSTASAPEGAAASMLSAVRHAMRRRRAGRRRDGVGKSGWASGGRGVATVAWVKGFIDGLQYRETQIGTTPAIIPQSATRRYCFATPL